MATASDHKLLFAASEVVPFAKTGGLADVVSALPRTLAKLRHRVSVFIPYYRQVAKAVANPPVILPSVTIPFPSYNRFVRVLNGEIPLAHAPGRDGERLERPGQVPCHAERRERR